MSAIITIDFVVPAGHDPGDYAKLYSNGDSGDIDWESPYLEGKFDLFYKGGGIYGFGHAPFGHHRFGHGHSMRTAGFGHLPFGRFPFGHGTSVITAKVPVSDCGDWKFAFACFDKAGNQHQGTPEETVVAIHIAPEPPTGLAKNSYNKDTDVLILDAA